MSKIRVSDPVAKLVRRGAVYVWPDTSLREVAEILERESIGLVVVHRTGGIAGVVSERDIIRAVAEGADPEVERAADVMTYDVTFAQADDPIDLVATTMIEGDVRHVPVDGCDGGTAVVSIRDVLPVFVDAAGGETPPECANRPRSSVIEHRSGRGSREMRTFGPDQSASDAGP